MGPSLGPPTCPSLASTICDLAFMDRKDSYLALPSRAGGGMVRVVGPLMGQHRTSWGGCCTWTCAQGRGGGTMKSFERSSGPCEKGWRLGGLGAGKVWVATLIPLPCPTPVLPGGVASLGPADAARGRGWQCGGRVSGDAPRGLPGP